MEVSFEVGKKSVSYQLSKKREGHVPKRDLGARNKETLKSFSDMSLAPVNPESQFAGMNQVWDSTTYSYII